MLMTSATFEFIQKDPLEKRIPFWWEKDLESFRDFTGVAK
jgi:hypothetical protein